MRWLDSEEKYVVVEIAALFLAVLGLGVMVTINIAYGIPILVVGALVWLWASLAQHNLQQSKNADKDTEP